MSTLKVNTVESATTPTVNVTDGLHVTGVSTVTGGINVGTAATIHANGNVTCGIVTSNAFVPSQGQLSHRNLIINGAMQVAQRGTTTTQATGFLIDRFNVENGNVDENSTVTQADVGSGTTPYTLGFRKALKVQNGNQTSGAGASDYIQIFYRFEAQDMADSGWNYKSTSSFITLSFWIKSSVAQVFSGSLRSRDGTALSYKFDTPSLSADTWTKVTYTIPGNSNLHFDNNAENGLDIFIYPFIGTTFTSSNANTETWITAATDTYANNMTTTWYTTNNATWEITGMQFEVGSNATDFEFRTFGDELALCQRYCCKWWNNGGTTANHSRFPVGHTNSTSSMAFWLQHPVPMRTTDGKTITHNIGQIQPINQGASQYNPAFTLTADGQQELISMIQLGLQSGRTENQIAYFRVGGGQTDWYLIIANEL